MDTQSHENISCWHHLGQNSYHSRKPKQKRLFLNMLQFEGVEIEEVDDVPIDINGTHIYRINCPENEWIVHQKDHHWWKMQTSSRKGFQGERKIGTCQGHFICTNRKCDQVKVGMSENQFCFQQVGPYKICSTCGMFIEQMGCGAMKLTEDCPVNATLVVYHHGQHKYITKGNEIREQKAQGENVVESALQSNFKAKPCDIMLSKVTYYLSQGVEEEAEETPLLLSKTKGICNIRANHPKKLFSTERHSYPAIANAKQKLDLVDPFLVYKFNGDNSTGVPKYIYKASWDMAMLALELNTLDDENTSPLKENFFYISIACIIAAKISRHSDYGYTLL